MATPPSHTGPATPAPAPAPAPKAAAARPAATTRQLTDAVHDLIATTQQYAVSIGTINTSLQGMNGAIQSVQNRVAVIEAAIASQGAGMPAP